MISTIVTRSRLLEMLVSRVLESRNRGELHNILWIVDDMNEDPRNSTQNKEEQENEV